MKLLELAIAGKKQMTCKKDGGKKVNTNVLNTHTAVQSSTLECLPNVYFSFISKDSILNSRVWVWFQKSISLQLKVKPEKTPICRLNTMLIFIEPANCYKKPAGRYAILIFFYLSPLNFPSPQYRGNSYLAAVKISGYEKMQQYCQQRPWQPMNIFKLKKFNTKASYLKIHLL